MAIVGENNNISGVSLSHITYTLKDSMNKVIMGNRIDLSPGKQTAVFPDDGHAYWLYQQNAQDVDLDHIRLSPYHGHDLVVYTG